jgi:hypothetical protein
MEPWRIALLPDTQVYSRLHPEIFEAQTRWIMENRDRLNIACTLHLGDITDHNTPEQWENARCALEPLTDCVSCLGNHDYGENGATDSRETLAHRYLRPAPAAQLFDPSRLDNSFRLFEALDGSEWLVISLEFGPRAEIVEWASEVAAEHADRHAILLTHAYLYDDGTRYDWSNRRDQKWSPYLYGVAEGPGGVSDGEDLWRKLVSRHPNFRFVFCGHVLGCGAASLTSPGPGGPVHQVLANYQMNECGGGGFLRLVEMHPDGRILMRSYSPWRDEWLRDPLHEFEL